MVRAGVALLLFVALACAVDESERGRRHTDTSGDDLATVELIGQDARNDGVPADDAVPGDTVLRPDVPRPDVPGPDVPGPDVPGPDDTLDATDPGPRPEPDAADVTTTDVPDTSWPPEVELPPDVAEPEPHPEVAEVVPDTTSPSQTAYDLQTSAASVDCVTDAGVTIGPARLEGLVIASPRFLASAELDGYYAADSASYGAYHGLLLVVPTALATNFVVGDVVTVEGDHKEYFCMTEVFVASVAKVGVAWEPPPTELAGWQLAATDPASEPYEGSLVRLQGGTVTLVDSYGEIVIDGTWRIANQFDLAYLGDLGGKAVGDTILSVTGVVEYSWGKYLVNPRFDDDLIVSKP